MRRGRPVARGQVSIRGLTSYGFGVPRTLAPGDEDDILLARVGIVVFKKEELVDSIIL